VLSIPKEKAEQACYDGGNDGDGGDDDQPIPTTTSAERCSIFKSFLRQVKIRFLATRFMGDGKKMWVCIHPSSLLFLLLLFIIFITILLLLLTSSSVVIINQSSLSLPGGVDMDGGPLLRARRRVILGTTSQACPI